MDILAQYRAIIQHELQEYAEIPYAHGDLKCRLIIIGLTHSQHISVITSDSVSLRDMNASQSVRIVISNPSFSYLMRKSCISEDRNDFLLITQGWEDDLQVHGCLVHIEIIGDKICIEMV